ncbi:MAG: universal stress protein [Anaerolineales bacterium]|nr:universal stress protein [Anaerolineales bacterium]MCB9127098.1 universal stress protein [Ardenticatenales bacterium]
MTIFDGPMMAVVDGSTSSLTTLPHAALSAATLNLPLRIIHLFDEEKNPAFRGTATAVRRLEEAVAGLTSHEAVEVETVHPKRLLTYLLQRVSTETGIVALPHERRSWLSTLRFSNRHEQILQRTPLAVLLLGPDQAVRRLAHLLFPVDLSTRSNALFAETVALCAAHQATLHLLHLFGPDRPIRNAEEAARRAAASSPREMVAMDEQRLTAMAEQAEASGVVVARYTAEGRAHNGILQYAASQPIDLIVMASHGARNREDVLRGSTTIRVMQRSPVPVLALRSRPAE